MASTPGFEPRPHWWEASALTLDAPRGVATAERQKGCIAGKKSLHNFILARNAKLKPTVSW